MQQNAPSPTRRRKLTTQQWAFLTAVTVAIVGLIPFLITRFAPEDGSSAPSGTTGYQLTSAASVPQCSDVTGSGARPEGREVAMFVQVPGDTRYYWEKKLDFEGTSWRVPRVVVGAPADSGKLFHLVLVPVTTRALVEFQQHDGTAYSLEILPAEPLARFAVTRNDQLGNC